MTLTTIAEQHRVPCKRSGPTLDDEKIIPGKRGHIWQDGRHLMICFTDDGAAKPLTPRVKAAAITKLEKALVKITQDAEAEFCGVLATDHDSVERAIRVLGIKRFKVTKGISRPVPLEFHLPGVQRGFTAQNRSELGLQVVSDHPGVIHRFPQAVSKSIEISFNGEN